MIKAYKLNGKKVITADAFNLGEVSEVVMNDRLKISYIHVKLAREAIREFGLRRPALGHFAVCLPADLVKGFADVITLKASRKELSVLVE